MTRIVWVLNLDADVELAGGNSYTPSKAVEAAMAPHRSRLAQSLLGPADVELANAIFNGPRTDVVPTGNHLIVGRRERLATYDLLDQPSAPRVTLGGLTALPNGGPTFAESSAAPHPHGEALVGRAFCPTPRAVAALRAVGVEPEAYPSVEVLRAVNSRAFCAELGQTLPGAVFARTFGEAVAVIAAAPPAGRQWRAKPAFGMAGRGQRPIAAGALSEADAAFLRANIARGGIQIEPEVPIVRELAIHGMLGASGGARIGRLVLQQCDFSGQWLASTPLEAASPLGIRLTEEAERVAVALHSAGYFGPFGIDAFEYLRADGVIQLQPRSEINARYSMGFAASGLLD